jgi:hypothetical protein
LKRLSGRCDSQGGEALKQYTVLDIAANVRLDLVDANTGKLWTQTIHWMLAKYPDPMGRRVLLVPNPGEFQSKVEKLMQKVIMMALPASTRILPRLLMT